MAKFANISSATTTAIKSGRGVLYGIVNNNAVANGVITVYNNTAGSGARIATITNPATLTNNQYSLNYQRAEFTTGLTVVTSAADNITVIYD